MRWATRIGNEAYRPPSTTMPSAARSYLSAALIACITFCYILLSITPSLLEAESHATSFTSLDTGEGRRAMPEGREYGRIASSRTHQTISPTLISDASIFGQLLYCTKTMRLLSVFPDATISKYIASSHVDAASRHVRERTSRPGGRRWTMMLRRMQELRSTGDARFAPASAGRSRSSARA